MYKDHIVWPHSGPHIGSMLFGLSKIDSNVPNEPAPRRLGTPIRPDRPQ